MDVIRGWWERYQQASRSAQIGLGCGALVVVILLVTVGRAVAGGQPGGSVTTQQRTPTVAASAGTATPAPTATVMPSATPYGKIVTGATFGGLQTAFLAKYGGDGTLYSINGVTFALMESAGVDGQQHVSEMLVYKSDESNWTLPQARAACTPFLPPDAKYARLLSDPNSDPEDVYTSVLFAATFGPLSSWYDPTKTVTITYLIKNGGVYQCEIDPFIL